MDRKKFIQLIPGLVLLGIATDSCRSRKSAIRSRIVGANAAAGHLLRDKKYGTPTSTIQKDIVIAGAGISGLTAAWYLQQRGITDFIILDLEAHAGGNSAHGVNAISAYPWGAHYVPVPNNGLTEYKDFLQEAGVITGYDQQGLPVYNEEYLCFDPQERLFINGRWQEGLIPQFGVPTAELQQMEKFLQQMNTFRYAKGNDNLDAFAIPAVSSSRDEAYIKLDAITMKEWLLANGFTSAYIHSYVNYCCRDDFGTTHDVISAWAGIHYFAARKGKGANAEHSDVLTWPEGNGFLAAALQKNIAPYIQTSSLVTRVVSQQDGVIVEYTDVRSGVSKAIAAKQCILALPQFVAARILGQEERKAAVKQNFSYAPWMVANVVTAPLKEREGYPMSWDNVIHNGPSLGYVDATHQLLQQNRERRNLTCYFPLTDGTPAAERKKAQERTAEEWEEMIVADLEQVHPGARDAVEEINIMLWGHAMIQPLPGFITGMVRQEMGASIDNKIHFAHTDLAGISIFEEAFYQGLHAAKRVMGQS